MDNKPILVLGAGSWGTAMALVLARNGHPTYLWDCISEHIEDLIKDGCNKRYLPGIEFPECLVPSNNLQTLVKKVDDIVIAVPCEGLRDVSSQIAGFSTKQFNLCLASKGLEPDSLSLNHMVVGEVLDDVKIAILTGPSFAREVAQGIPTAVTIASVDSQTASNFSEFFHSDVFRIYTHDDVIGAQVGGAVKNVMAIAAGISDGLGYGSNSRAALITRGLAEITRLGVAMGGRQETFMGLTGLGDLVLTCTDDQSRNRQLGLALAKGKTLEQAQEDIGQAIEGVRTVSAVHKLAQEYQIEMPISEQIFKLIYGDINPKQAVQALLSRDRKAELN